MIAKSTICLQRKPIEMSDDNVKDWISQVQEFRKGKDEFFATSHDSPLAHGKTGSFKGLRYFSPDPRYKILANLHRYDNPEKVTMTTSKGTRQQFHRLGYFEFDIEGKKVKIQAYKSAERESNELFIPFKDGTSGKESYGAARYLDIEENPDDEYVVDFNYAYNPYCAYSQDYVCPLPPKENWLEVRILAGEMNYHG
jgi:uncharacterized protein (DUF1684 family)